MSKYSILHFATARFSLIEDKPSQTVEQDAGGNLIACVTGSDQLTAKDAA